jgi:acyl-CoA thioesterase
MAKYHVTLKANLADGALYWVADVNAATEDAAMTAAEASFARQMDNAAEWSFTEADVEPL